MAVVVVGASVSEVYDGDADDGGRIDGSVGSVVDGVLEMSTAVGTSETITDAGADVGWDTVVGTGAAAAGCVEGAGVFNEVGPEVKRTAVGDGVGDGVCVGGTRCQGTVRRYNLKLRG